MGFSTGSSTLRHILIIWLRVAPLLGESWEISTRDVPPSRDQLNLIESNWDRGDSTTISFVGAIRDDSTIARGNARVCRRGHTVEICNITPHYVVEKALNVMKGNIRRRDSARGARVRSVCAAIARATRMPSVFTVPSPSDAGDISTGIAL